MKKLNWKKKYLGDKSGHWHEAKVKSIDWTYIIDSNIYDGNLYGCYLWINSFDNEVEISKKKYKTLEAAQNFCQKHLETVANKLQKEMLK
jgi:hypothetical protein